MGNSIFVSYGIRYSIAEFADGGVNCMTSRYVYLM